MEKGPRIYIYRERGRSWCPAGAWLLKRVNLLLALLLVVVKIVKIKTRTCVFVCVYVDNTSLLA